MSFPVAGDPRMSPINEKNWWGARAKSPALPCGEVDEPAKAGGTAITNRVSGFLVAEACTPRGVATHLGKHWLNEPSAITSNAGTKLSIDPNGKGFGVQGSRFVLGSGFNPAP